MIKNRVELLMRRRNVVEFREADELEVVLKRRAKIPSAGGWKWGPETPLAPQRVRIVPAKRRYGDETVNTEQGAIPTWPYVILGEPDMDIQEGDKFTWAGDDYIVKSIEADTEERTVAAVTKHEA